MYKETNLFGVSSFATPACDNDDEASVDDQPKPGTTDGQSVQGNIIRH